MKNIEKKIAKKIGKAIFQYKMIEPGDKILVGVSGGKDSLTLLFDLIKRRKSFPIPFEIEAAHIQTDFCTCCSKDKLRNLLDSLDVTYHIIDVPVLKRLAPGKKMNCYWCSTQRRIELLALARERGCTKIALGHHMDDVAETLFMNICYKGEISGMLPRFSYDNFPGVVIRPLVFVQEEEIIKYAENYNIKNTVCKCPYDKNSKRKEVRTLIRELAKNAEGVQKNILRSMHNVNHDYLLTDSEICKF